MTVPPSFQEIRIYLGFCISGVASLYSVMVFLSLIMLDSVLDPLDVPCKNEKGTRDESGIPKDLGYKACLNSVWLIPCYFQHKGFSSVRS
jgi:hypothetical protein